MFVLLLWSFMPVFLICSHFQCTTMPEANRNQLIAPAVVLAIAILFSSVIFAKVQRDNKRDSQRIEATGSAKRSIKSDYAILHVRLTGNGEGMADAYRDLQRQKPQVLAQLRAKGFAESAIKVSAPQLIMNYEKNGNGFETGRVISYQYTQEFRLESGDVYAIEKLSQEITALVEQGLVVVIDPPQYFYTKLAELKIEIQAEAAADAALRAKRIAEATGRTLGPLQAARMGVLQITPKNSNEIADYGMNDVSSIEKEITAVVNGEFIIN